MAMLREVSFELPVPVAVTELKAVLNMNVPVLLLQVNFSPNNYTFVHKKYLPFFLESTLPVIDLIVFLPYLWLQLIVPGGHLTQADLLQDFEFTIRERKFSFCRSRLGDLGAVSTCF